MASPHDSHSFICREFYGHIPIVDNYIDLANERPTKDDIIREIHLNHHECMLNRVRY
jgi:hypothetical protein